jgi:hypothetical protein
MANHENLRTLSFKPFSSRGDKFTILQKTLNSGEFIKKAKKRIAQIPNWY